MASVRALANKVRDDRKAVPAENPLVALQEKYRDRSLHRSTRRET